VVVSRNPIQLSTWAYKCHFSLVEMLIHAGARVFYENEDLACPTQLACKTALLKVLMHSDLKLRIPFGNLFGEKSVHVRCETLMP
jgi:hypothetical protein